MQTIQKNSLAIQLQSSYFVAGQQINGCVALQLAGEMTLMELNLRLDGVESTKIIECNPKKDEVVDDLYERMKEEERNKNVEEGPEPKYTYSESKQSIKIVDQTTSLIPSGTVLQPGSYTYPFSIVTSRTWPSNLDLDYSKYKPQFEFRGTVQYQLEVWATDAQGQRLASCLVPIKLVQEPGFAAQRGPVPAFGLKPDVVYWPQCSDFFASVFNCGRGSISCSVSLEKDCFKPDEDINFKCEIDARQATIGVASSTVSFRQEILLKSNLAQDKRIVVHSRSLLPPVKAGQVTVFDSSSLRRTIRACSIKPLRGLFPTTVGSLISNRYFVQLEVRLAGCFQSDPQSERNEVLVFSRDWTGPLPIAPAGMALFDQNPQTEPLLQAPHSTTQPLSHGQQAGHQPGDSAPHRTKAPLPTPMTVPATGVIATEDLHVK